MGWRDHLLRLMARGELTPAGRDWPDTDVVLRVLDRIEADPRLAAHLDTLDPDGVRDTFLTLYGEEE